MEEANNFLNSQERMRNIYGDWETFYVWKVSHYRSEELIIQTKVIPQGNIKRNKVDVMLHLNRVTLIKTWLGTFCTLQNVYMFFLDESNVRMAERSKAPDSRLILP